MVLVTGATGLVGSHLLFELLQKGKKVRALRRTNSNLSDVGKIFGYYSTEHTTLLEKIEWVKGDITDKMSIYDAMEGVEEVYHTAAVVSFSSGDKYKILEYNVQGTASIVDIALEKGIKKLCFVSSTAALGSPGENGYIDETCTGKISKGQSVYSLSKFKSEMEIWRGMAEGLNAVIINPSVIIGPGNWQKSSSRIFYEIWKGLKFYTKGITGFVDIRDVVNFMIYLMENNIYGERFIISEGNYSYQEIFKKIAESLGIKGPSIYATKTIAQTAYYLDNLICFFIGKNPVITKETIHAGRNQVNFTNDKIIKTTGLSFTPINESIKKTAEFFLQDIKNHNIG